MPKEIIIPKNNDGGVYRCNPLLPPYNAQPGDTIILEGDYLYISFLDMQVPAGQPPIRIVNRGANQVRIGYKVGSYNAYGIIFYNCVGFVLDGTGTPGLKYGIKIAPEKVGIADKFMAQGIGGSDSSDYEIKNIELAHCEAGILQNPAAPSRMMKNIKIHDLSFSDMGNPTEGGRSECLYIGNTGATTLPVHFDGMEIYNILVNGTTGDGIQVSKANNLKIHHCTIKNYGKAKLQDQNSGIILGGYCTGSVMDNEISDGTGSGIQVFGFGNCTVVRNNILRTSTQPNCDGIYISRRGAPTDKLQCDVTGNTIDGSARYGVFHDDFAATGRPGTWSGNVVAGAAGGKYFSNCGDVIVDKVLLCTVKVFTDGTTETTKV